MADAFSFNVGAPVQGAVQGGGGYRGSNIQGGQASGSDRSPEALGGAALGTGLGDYFDKLMQPALEREARSRFVKGMTDQMYAAAGHEIRTGDGLLSKIFGPTDYEQGAMYYESQNRVATAMQGWSAREDELKRLPKEEVAKEWAKTMESTMVGDPFLDDLVTQDMLKQSAPALQAVAKANYKFGQETVIKNQQSFWGNLGTAFQAQGQQFADTQDPTDEQAQGYASARNNFLQAWQKPAGQDDESYQTSVLEGFRSLLRSGNGHGATALVQSGLLRALPEDKQVALMDQYDKFAQKAVGEGATAFLPRIDVLQGKMTFGQLTGEQSVAEMRAINDGIKRQTGFDADYFDTSDQESALKGVWSSRKAALDRQQALADELARDVANDKRREEMEIRKEERKRADIETAWNSDSPAAAIAAGVVDKDGMSARAFKAYMDNDFVGLQRTWKGAGLVSPEIKNSIQNTVLSAANTGYTPEFGGLVDKFNAMVKVNPALAKEYFGPVFPSMLRYNQLSTGQTPAAAFSMSFNGVMTTPDNGQTAQAKKDVLKYVADQQPGFVSRSLFGNKTLNTSGSNALANLIGREVAQDSQYASSDLSKDTLIKAAHQRVINNGTFEQYGRIGWSNGKPTTPLYRLMGMQQSEASHVIETLVDRKLKQNGAPEGVSAEEMLITRQNQNGKDVLIVVPLDKDGVPNSHLNVVLGIDALKAGGKTYRTELTAKPPAPKKTGKGLLGYGGAGGDFITGNNK